ncbi:hypothetical protein OMAG_000889 [Candidatus Omnitrophus magneticus]|uniref:Uncharacterized protein n=1 Tax=Candidatus Omnitrophus magneticus TaxID=1609969 RepID=A0A0F0CPK0_9BACT|nr:hypothetical protein OMAG_000889 [Candidatus Omnitrophus magneticus]
MSFIFFSPNTSFNFNAITAREYESLDFPASITPGTPRISPNVGLL